MNYPLYKKQVEAWKEREKEFEIKISNFLVAIELRKSATSISSGEHSQEFVEKRLEELKQFIRPRHKDTIELLEAIIKEVEGINIPDGLEESYGAGMETMKDDIITTLQAELEIIKKEI